MKEKYTKVLEKIGNALKKIISFIALGFALVFRAISYPFRYGYTYYSSRPRRNMVPLKQSFLYFWKDENEGAEELYEYELEKEKEKQQLCMNYPMAPYCADNTYFPA